MTHNSHYRMRIDRGAYTFLAVCSCGWRDYIPRVSNVEAWRAARGHECSCHAGGTQAARGFDAARRRLYREP